MATVSGSAGTAIRPTFRFDTAAFSRHGATATCAKRRGQSTRRCSWRTSGPRPTRRHRRPTVIRFVAFAATALLAHNELVRKYPAVRRDLMVAIAPKLFASIEGSTDSEVLFFLALTFGLELAPVTALSRGWSRSSKKRARHRVEEPLNMTVCATDGEQIIAVRYSSERQSRTLFHNTSFRQMHELYPDDPRIAMAGQDAFLVVSGAARRFAGLVAGDSGEHGGGCARRRRGRAALKFEPRAA